MKNIILIGMPGSGKTTIGKDLAKKLNMNFLDFDDDVIEKTFNKSVAEKLEELGEEKFLEMEKDLALSLDIENTVLATSGSVVLKQESMEKLSKLGIIIYLEVPIEEIKRRLETMKVDRIVGMKDMTMDEILNYRKTFYEKKYDCKITLPVGKTKEEVFDYFMKNCSILRDFI